MANAAIVIRNLALEGQVSASSQELAMPAANLMSPHTTERWRSVGSSAFVVLDLGAVLTIDTVMVKGLTGSAALELRLRLSTVDSDGAAGDAFDSGDVSNASANLDVDYGAGAWALNTPTSCRFVRIDFEDAQTSYVEAGVIVAGLREAFEYNFAPGSSVQYVDRSRVATTAAGLSQVEDDAWFRRVDLSFELPAGQRYGLIERLDRTAGRRRNVLLLLDEQSDNLARDAIFGLVTDLTPNTFAEAIAYYGKQLRIDERL